MIAWLNAAAEFAWSTAPRSEFWPLSLWFLVQWVWFTRALAAGIHAGCDRAPRFRYPPSEDRQCKPPNFSQP